MIKSMTGYGRADFSIENESFFVEIKSLNHRFLDINARIPDRFFALEIRLKEEIKKRFSRGSFMVLLYSEGYTGVSLKVNLPVARAYLDAAEELKRELGVKGEADISLLLKLKDIFYSDRKTLDSDAAWAPLKKALDSALDQVDAWRVREGSALKDDLTARLVSFETLLSKVEKRAPEVVESYRERFKSDLEKVIREAVDESRILLEAAVFAERADVSEEITRLRSHLEMFRGRMDADTSVGKPLDFLCQELFREVNTITSKANDTVITQTGVTMKGELEKIREQVQNIE